MDKNIRKAVRQSASKQSVVASAKVRRSRRLDGKRIKVSFK